jgi:hypothetical protein
MHKRVFVFPFLLAVMFFIFVSFIEIYAIEGNEWLGTPFKYSLFIIIPFAFYITYRLTTGEDEDIQTLGLTGSSDNESESNSTQ